MPPLRMSLPAPPFSVSLPSSPFSVSVPASPLSVSLPSPPLSVSLPPLPLIVLLRLVAGAREVADADEGQRLDLRRERVGIERGQHRVGALARVLDHGVLQAVDEIGVVADPARHGVVAGAAIEPVVAVAAVEDVVAGKSGDDVSAALAEDLVLAGGADQRVARIVADDQVADHTGGRRRHRFERIAVVDIGHDDAQHQADLVLRGHEQLAVGAGDGRPGYAIGRLLPLECEATGENCILRAVGVDDGERIHRQRPAFGGSRGAERRRCRGCVVDVGDQRGRRREHGLQHAVGILVDSLDTQREADLGIAGPKGRAGRADIAKPGGDDDVFEDAVAARVDLPDVGDGPVIARSDCTAQGCPRRSRRQSTRSTIGLRLACRRRSSAGSPVRCSSLPRTTD